MANSADPDQLASKPTDLDLHCLERQGISGASRTRVKYSNTITPDHTGPITYLSGNVFKNCWIIGKEYRHCKV